MKVFIGSDHAGFKYKQEIKKYLTTLNVAYEDMGNRRLDRQDDYPDFAKKVAQKVAKTKGSRGILICDTGVGACIVANKFPDIRATNVYDLEMARKSREHNNSNVLCLGQDYLTLMSTKKIVKKWLETKFSIASRHHRRVNKIKQIEKRIL